MRIRVAPGAGFCFGVRRAMKIAFEAARKGNGPVFSLGPLIHNPQVVARLEEEGLQVVDSLDDVEGGTLVVRSHGLPGEVLREAAARRIEIVDATCPFVKKVQNCAVQLEEEGYAVVVVGEEDHPEVLSITGNLRASATVIDGPHAVERLADARRIGVVCQTTQPPEHLRTVVSALLEHTEELRVFDTICEATFERQENALKLAREVDLMLVVGGKNSANTRRLWELCREENRRAYHIETADELRPEWFEGTKEVGITGGASTPQWIVDEVVRRAQELECSQP